MKQILTLAALVLALNSYSQTKISSSELSKHIGDSVAVTEKVYGGRFLESSSLTLINLGGSFFTVVIRGTDRDKFEEKPETVFTGQTVTVYGRVTEFKGKPQLIVYDPKQIVKAE